jgi:hypothetical protein
VGAGGLPKGSSPARSGSGWERGVAESVPVGGAARLDRLGSEALLLEPAGFPFSGVPLDGGEPGTGESKARLGTATAGAEGVDGADETDRADDADDADDADESRTRSDAVAAGAGGPKPRYSSSLNRRAALMVQLVLSVQTSGAARLHPAQNHR